MNSTRLDVSGVPPQGGYLAKQCPVVPQWNVLLDPALKAPDSEAVRLRMDRGVAFEAAVVAELVDDHPDAVVVERDGPEGRTAREAETLAAMESGAPVIIGGRLPVDEGGRRVGEPDVLVAAEGGGYHPVDVKHHRTLGDDDTLPAHCADLSSPWFHTATTVEDGTARKRKDDLVQLAHYRWMLEACGQAAGSNHGGIIGTERMVVWFDLDSEIWTTPSRSRGTKKRSTMDVYDFEFGFRLDIIAKALALRSGELDDSPQVVPVKTGDCNGCGWWPYCGAHLDNHRDISLLPGIAWTTWKAHRDRGVVSSIPGLAALDHRTATLRDANVDLPTLFVNLDGLDAEADGTPIGEVIGRRRRRQIENLRHAGVVTAGDARPLDRRVAALHKAPVGKLAESIDQARAWLGSDPAYLRRGVTAPRVPRADLEIDVDMENTVDGTYLWGSLVIDRASTGLTEPGYRHFATWDPDPADGEIGVFAAWLDWLLGTRAAAERAGHTVAVYCYHRHAEETEMKRLARLMGDKAEAAVAELIAKDDSGPPTGWVDMENVLGTQVITGTNLGLKRAAGLAGFRWDDDDPGGEQSMAWHHAATTDPDPAVRQQNRQRLLAYNRNDVEATHALRDWLETEGPRLPRIADLDGTNGDG